MKELRSLGLSENQAELYLCLLREREAPASRLSRLCGINRSTTYSELDSLVKEGLSSFVIRNSKRLYRASPPETLLARLDEKRASVSGILPLLKGMGREKRHDVRVEVYEGKEGVKAFYQHVLNENPKEVMAFGVTGLAFEKLEYAFPQFMKKYVKAGLKARYLANHDSRKRLARLPKNRVSIKYLPEEYSSPVTTAIYNDFVAIQSLDGRNFYVILIEDKRLAHGYARYFEFMWDLLK